MNALPKWYGAAERELGLAEIPGPKSHPRILELAQHARVDWYKNDDTAWCAIFVNGILAECGYTPTGNAMARGFESSPHSRRVKKPYKGCIATFWRGSPKTGFGHVGIYDGETAKYIKLLGGNQGSPGAVTRSQYPKSRHTGYWEPVTYDRAANDNAAPAKPSHLFDVAGNAAPMSRNMFTRTAKDLGCEPAMVAAVWQIEAGGKAFFPDGRVKILFERHVFYKELPAAKRAEAVRRGLALPKRSPRTQYKDQVTADQRYELVKRAMELDETAAWRSFSMGGPQIMGFNCRLAGFQTPKDMFLAMRDGEDAHFDAFIGFVRSAGLVDELQRKDFTGFTRGYNGPGQIPVYAPKLKQAYQRFSKSLPATGAANDNVPELPAGSIRMGDYGDKVRHYQRRLVEHGFRVQVDGDFGPETKRAVDAFQRKQNLDMRDFARGVLTPRTQEALDEGAPVKGEWDPQRDGFTPDPEPAPKPKSLLGQLLAAILKIFTGGK